MKSRSRSNNLVAILIALVLFATGFALLFIHKQSESKQEQVKTPTALFDRGATTNETAQKPNHPVQIS